MDDDTQRWLVAEVDRLSELKRTDMHRLLKRGLLILAMLAAAFAVGWYAISGLAERLISVIFPFGIGLILVSRVMTTVDSPLADRLD